MLRLSIFIALAFAGKAAICAEAFSLRTEYSKNPIYEGESVTAKFILFGTPSFVEAEVAKFPEFRGFWTQNHVLRQGPLPLVPEPGPNPLNQALIGSYTITPMVGKRSPEVIPMKMILRSHDFFSNDSGGEGMEIWSDKEALQVLPLPPVPTAMHSKFFGAVGNLALFIENEVVTFRPEEPFSFRIAARGQANFPDITELGVQWPERAQLVSKRTFLDPTLPPTKVFEYTAVIHGEAPLEIPPIEMAYFNPAEKQYVIASTPAIRLEPQAAPPLEFLGPDAFGTPLAQEQLLSNWRESALFWSMQAFFLLLLLGTLWKRGRSLWESRPATLLSRYLKGQRAALEGALSSESPDHILTRLERLLMRGNARSSHPQALDKMKQTWSKDSIEEAKWVFETWDKGFAPPDQRPQPAPPSRLGKAVKRLLAALRRPF